jgi:putative hydrolase
MLDIRQDFHVHSNYNDHSAANLTISNVVNHAQKIGLDSLAITEHVNMESSWVEEYLNEIELASQKADIKVIPGFEAKILRDGSINCPKEYGQYFLIASFHTLYKEKSVWIHALENAIRNPQVNVIGHLGPEPTFSLERNEIRKLGKLISTNNKLVELNAKYHRPPKDWLIIFKECGVQFHLGSDAHSLDDIGRFETIMDLIALVNAS